MPRKKSEDFSFGPRPATLRKARGLTQVQPSSIVMVLAQAPQLSADELLGLKPPPTTATAASDDDADTRRLWKRFQVVAQLPEKDQRAVIRLINSLAAITVPRQGERNGR